IPPSLLHLPVAAKTAFLWQNSTKHPPQTRECRASRTLLFLSTHLHFEAFGILNMKTAFGGPDLQSAAFQLGFNRRLHIFVRVPTGDCVSDMIYFTRRGPVANDENVVAERQAALHSVIS